MFMRREVASVSGMSSKNSSYHPSRSHSHLRAQYHRINLEELRMDPNRLPRLSLAESQANSLTGAASGMQQQFGSAIEPHTVAAMGTQSIERSQNNRNRMPGGRRRERRQSRESSLSSVEDDCCASCCSSCCLRNCNSQICCSYIIALVSTCFVVGGVYLSLLYWNRLWLAFSLFGLVLVFFGACMYCCGTKALSRKYDREDEEGGYGDCYEEDFFGDEGHRRQGRGKRKRRNRAEDLDQGASDRRVNAARSLSQLSLNMIPQYFAPSDTGSTAPGQLLASSRTNTLMTTASAGNQSQAASVHFSQIFSLNGQSFLILPIATESVEASRNRNSSSSEQSIPLNSLVVKVATPEEETNEAGPVRKPTVTEFLAKLDPKSYCLLKSGHTQSSQVDDVGMQTEEDSSLVSVPSFASSRPSISCDDSGINSISQASKDPQSSAQSFDASSPSSSFSARAVVVGGALKNQKQASTSRPKPAVRASKSVPATSVVTVNHNRSSVTDSSFPLSSSRMPISVQAADDTQEHHATTSTSFFLSFPAETSGGVRTEKGNPQTLACLQSDHSTARSLTSDDQNLSQNRFISGDRFDAPATSTSTASSLIRKDTFSKKGKTVVQKSLVQVQESGSSSEASSPNDQQSGANLIDLISRQRDSLAEAEAERNHAVYTTSGSHLQDLAYDSSDLEDSDFMSPPPSYAEVIDSSVHFDSTNHLPCSGPTSLGTL